MEYFYGFGVAIGLGVVALAIAGVYFLIQKFGKGQG